MDFFAGLEFPYSKEIKDIKKESLPNLDIENENQSFYSVLKYIRNELIFKKLKTQKKLAFDIYINDIIGLSDFDVDQYYPPENIEKLNSFLQFLEESNVPDLHYYSAIYYLLKDFSFSAAERFINFGSKHSNQTIIPKYQYDFINSIYYIDKLDILKFLKHLDNDYLTINNKKFTNHLIRLANIIPYLPNIPVTKLNSVNEFKTYLEIKSSRETSLSVVSIVSSLQMPVLTLDLDILLIYLDALTDISPLDSVLLFEQLSGNYQPNTLKVSLPLILNVIVKKLLIKTIKQKEIIDKLFKQKLIDKFEKNQISDALAIFYLLNTKFESQLDLVLYKIATNSKTSNEDLLAMKFPNFFEKLNQYEKDVTILANDILQSKNLLKVDAGFDRVATTFKKQVAKA